MDFTENTNPKIRTILIVLTIGWFLLLQWWTTDQSDLVLFILIFGFCLLWIFWSLLKTDTERKKKEDERRENWEKTWKGEPEIFKLLEENKTPDDFRITHFHNIGVFGLLLVSSLHSGFHIYRPNNKNEERFQIEHRFIGWNYF